MFTPRLRQHPDAFVPYLVRRIQWYFLSSNVTVSIRARTLFGFACPKVKLARRGAHLPPRFHDGLRLPALPDAGSTAVF